MKRWIRLEWLIVLIAAAILLPLLFFSPVGVANNGDFYRMMLAGGIDFADPGESYRDKYFGYFHRLYHYGPFSADRYISSQIIPVFIAGIIGRAVNSQTFDIRILALLYSVLYVAALYIIVKSNKQRSVIFNTVLIASLSLVFLDVGYVAYFNSFFGEAVTVIFMLFTFGLALALPRTDKPSIWLLTAFYLSAVCLVGTKLQNAPIGLLLLLLGLRYWKLRADRAWRWTVGIWSAVLLLATVTMYAAAPSGLKHINLYQTVFFGVLKDSPDPAADLRELGLPEEFKVNAGTNYFQKDTVIKQNDPRIISALKEISHKDVLLYYAKHPDRFLHKLERAAKNGMSIRPLYLGSYEKEAGKPYGAISYAYSTWSTFKLKVMPNNFGFVAAFAAAYLIVLAVEYIRRWRSVQQRLYLEALFILALAGMFGFAVPLVGDGEADLGKHLFLFNVCFDMMMVVSVLYVVRIIVKKAGLLRGA
ncbi:glycan biosynthesis hexose transferase WsfD [Paenibacillus sp. MMO-177]|uniref:glycan biosynthesis hexose transferase WsfD n=1 Tax=Paenibacillus sp. MMO-177 TaxID=3081289 RepID=UPI00301A729E